MDLRDQKKFIITVIVIAVIAGVSVVIFYNHKNKPANPLTGTTLLQKEAQQKRLYETSGYFSVAIPHGWLANTFIMQSSSPIALNPVEKTELRAGPNDQEVNAGNAAVIQVFKANPNIAAWLQTEQALAAEQGDTITTASVNGQQAFLESAKSGGKTSLTYYIGRGQYIVRVYLPVTDTAAKIDNSQMVSQFNAMAKSVEILKQ